MPLCYHVRMETAPKGCRIARLLRRFDPDDLAERLALRPNTIYRWQAGKRLPRRSALPRLAAATGLSLPALRVAHRADDLARKETP